MVVRVLRVQVEQNAIRRHAGEDERRRHLLPFRPELEHRVRDAPGDDHKPRADQLIDTRGFQNSQRCACPELAQHHATALHRLYAAAEHDDRVRAARLVSRRDRPQAMRKAGDEHVRPDRRQGEIQHRQKRDEQPPRPPRRRPSPPPHRHDQQHGEQDQWRIETDRSLEERQDHAGVTS